MRAVFGLVLLACCVSLASAQTGIIVPRTVETAYLVNKTGKKIRFVISSAKGVHTELMENNTTAATYFSGARTRVVTIYDVGDPLAPTIVNDPIVLVPGGYYEVYSGPVPVTAPLGAPGGAPGGASRGGLRKLAVPPAGAKVPLRGVKPDTAP